MLSRGFLANGDRQGIVKRCDGIGKIDTVLPEDPHGFELIAFEAHGSIVCTPVHTVNGTENSVAIPMHESCFTDRYQEVQFQYHRWCGREKEVPVTES